jgi:hypothetical protein
MPEESVQKSPKDILKGIFEFEDDNDFMVKLNGTDVNVNLLHDPSRYNQIDQRKLLDAGYKLVTANLANKPYAFRITKQQVTTIIMSIEELYRNAQLDNKDYVTHFDPKGDTSITCGDATDVNICAKVGLGAGPGLVKYHNFIHGLQCLYHFNKLLDNALSENDSSIFDSQYLDGFPSSTTKFGSPSASLVSSPLFSTNLKLLQSSSPTLTDNSSESSGSDTDRSTGSSGSVSTLNLRDYLTENGGKNLLYCRLAALGHDAGHKGENPPAVVYTDLMKTATETMFDKLNEKYQSNLKSGEIMQDAKGDNENKEGPVIEEYHTALVLTQLKNHSNMMKSMKLDKESIQIIKDIIYATCLKKTLFVDNLQSVDVTQITENNILKTIIHLADLGNPLTRQHLVWAQGVAEERGKSKSEADNIGIHGIIINYLKKNTHIKQAIKNNIEGYIKELPKDLPDTPPPSSASPSGSPSSKGGRKRNKTKKRNKISKRKSNKCKKMCNHNKYLNCCKICIKKKHTKKKCKKMCKHNKYLSCCKKCHKK